MGGKMNVLRSMLSRAVSGFQHAFAMQQGSQPTAVAFKLPSAGTLTPQSFAAIVHQWQNLAGQQSLTTNTAFAARKFGKLHETSPYEVGHCHENSEALARGLVDAGVDIAQGATVFIKAPKDGLYATAVRSGRQVVWDRFHAVLEYSGKNGERVIFDMAAPAAVALSVQDYFRLMLDYPDNARYWGKEQPARVVRVPLDVYMNKLGTRGVIDHNPITGTPITREVDYTWYLEGYDKLYPFMSIDDYLGLG
jgi:hypothetical protein